MKIDRYFCRDVAKLCYDALEAAGFKRYRSKWVDWPLNADFHAWVGLNKGWNDNYFEINPFAGIHATKIERLWTSLSGLPYHRSSATYARHLGEISPSVLSFRFFRHSDLRGEAARMAELYATVGLSYAKSLANYESLLPLLQERVPMLGAYPERLACCLFLLGRESDARIFAEDFKTHEPDYFSKFAESFLSITQNYN